MVKQTVPRHAARAALQMRLIAVAISALFFLGAIRPALLQTNALFTLQLVLAIPVLLSGTLALEKAMTARTPERWRTLSGRMFTIGYAFIVNAVGMLIATLASVGMAQAFFLVCMLNPLVYSYFCVKDGDTRSRRISKDALFIGMVLLLGLVRV